LPKRKVIFVACGSGVASSETAAYKLRKLLADRKLDAEVVVVDFRRLKSIASQADILVHIAPNDPTDYGIPKVNGVPFLTGMGLNQVMDQIEKLIKS
jgi:PTS system galactitol-specific IIB component